MLPASKAHVVNVVAATCAPILTSWGTSLLSPTQIKLVDNDGKPGVKPPITPSSILIKSKLNCAVPFPAPLKKRKLFIVAGSPPNAAIGIVTN